MLQGNLGLGENGARSLLEHLLAGCHWRPIHKAVVRVQLSVEKEEAVVSHQLSVEKGKSHGSGSGVQRQRGLKENEEKQKAKSKNRKAG
jgi:hypothetical protein